MKRISTARRLVGTVICVLVLRFAPCRYEVEALNELSRLWGSRAK